jgi:hypothetical protein
MNGAVLGSKYFELASKTLHTVIPSGFGDSGVCQGNVIPPQSWTSMPRCSRYQALSRAGSFDLMKMPPMR